MKLRLSETTESVGSAMPQPQPQWGVWWYLGKPALIDRGWKAWKEGQPRHARWVAHAAHLSYTDYCEGPTVITPRQDGSSFVCV